MNDKTKPSLTAIEDSWRQETPVERPTDGWDDVEAQMSAKDTATMEERARCEAMVLGEIDRGRLRGITDDSGVMKILHRIAAAIRNG